MRGAWLAFLLFCLGGTAWAQGAIQQSGAVVPFHPGAFYSNGILGDGGSPGSPFINTLSLYNNGSNCPFTISSQASPGVYTGAYSQMSFCMTNSASTFTFSGVNGQANPNVIFNIGGVNYPFPGGYGTVDGPPSSVSGDVSCFNGTSGQLLEDCGSPSAIAGTALALSTVSGLPTCNSPAEGERRGVTDLLSPSFMSPVVGGGTVHGMAYCNGSTWIAA